MYRAVACFFANIKNHLASENVSGASLLWAIAALVVLGGVAAGVSRMNSTAVQEKISGEMSTQAYYAAFSGVQYFVSLQDDERELFKLRTDDARVVKMGDASFFITNIASDSDSWYIDVVGNAGGSGGMQSHYVLKEVVVGRTTKKNTPILVDLFDAISTEGSLRKTDDSSDTNNDGSVKGTNKNGVVVDSTAIAGSAYKFSSNYRGRVVHSFVEDYNIFYKGTIMVFLYPTSPVGDYAGIVHKGISKIVCDNGIFADEVYTLQFWPSGSGHVYKMFIIEGSENTSCSSSNKSCLCAGSSSWRYVEASSKTKVTSDKWQHVAITWEQNSSSNLVMKFYINGSLDSTTTVGSFIPRRNTADLVVGGQSDNDTGDQNTFYNGYMDDLEIYNRALSAEEVKNHFKTTRAAYCKAGHSTETICKANP
ncbi:MAG TPA: LamG domain-containing protein [Solidesulfovibrio magneticus]|nr:LamG domain-containing protein [Solidesulfovibrio magneticus]